MTLTVRDAAGRTLGTVLVRAGRLAGSNPGVHDIVTAVLKRNGAAPAAVKDLAGFSNGYITITNGGAPSVKTPAPERAAGRRRLAGQQQALPDGSFIVPDVNYLKRAIRSVGRAPASKRPALGALIRKRAKELKATNAPGVKGTWAFQGAGDQPAVELTGPGGWSHGWIRGKGVPENDFKPAPSMTKDELTRHLMNEHGGAPVPRSMRGTSRKAKGKAALVAHHEEMHRMLAAGSPLVNQGIGHSHGQHVSASLAGAHGKAIEMAGAMPRRMPKVRGAADVQMRRAGPGTITVQHKSSGMKVGTLAAKGRGWQGTHASGIKTPASGSQQGALAGLIAVHNRLAAGSKSPMAMVPAQQMGSAVAASSDAGDAVDLAGSLPVTTNASSSDGPRVTTMGSGKPAASGGPSGLSPYAQSVYKKLIAKGMKPDQAAALAKRAAAMHAKAA